MKHQVKNHLQKVSIHSPLSNHNTTNPHHQHQQKQQQHKNNQSIVPDIIVSIASGPSGLQLASYNLHTSVLISKSHYFHSILSPKQSHKPSTPTTPSSSYMNTHNSIDDIHHDYHHMKQSNTLNNYNYNYNHHYHNHDIYGGGNGMKRPLETLPLPFIDEHLVFPYIIKFMYDGELNVGEDKKVYVCALALKLDIPQILHIVRVNLIRETTPALIRYLNLSYTVLGIDEFIPPLTSALARRLLPSSPETEQSLFQMGTDLMELVLKSPFIPYEHSKDLKMEIRRYVRVREKVYGDVVSLKRLRGMENLGDQIRRMGDVIEMYGDRFRKMNSVDYVPLKVIRDIKEQFYSELKNVGDLEMWSFQVRADLLKMKRVSISLGTSGISSSSSQSIQSSQSSQSISNINGFESKSNLEKVETTQSNTQSNTNTNTTTTTTNRIDLKLKAPPKLDFKKLLSNKVQSTILNDPLIPMTPKPQIFIPKPDLSLISASSLSSPFVTPSLIKVHDPFNTVSSQMSIQMDGSCSSSSITSSSSISKSPLTYDNTTK